MGSKLFTKYYAAIITALAFILVVVTLMGPAAWGQKRIDLDDMEIRGELYNDNRLVIVGRDRNELKNYVKFRTNFRKELVEPLPTPVPGVK